MRRRSGLMWRKPPADPDPYWRDHDDLRGVICNPALVVGDLNRMERDYVDPEGRLPRETAEALGLDVDTVVRVMRHVLFEQQ